MKDISGNDVSNVCDTSGIAVSSISDVHSNPVTENVELDQSIPSTSWLTQAEKAYTNLLSAYNDTPPNRRIPFFVCTDQHGRGVDFMRWVHNRDADGMSIVSLNLGDVTTDVYNANQLTTLYERSADIKNYLGVVGNHDKKYSSETVDQSKLKEWFAKDRDKYAVSEADTVTDCYKAIDNQRGIKFIAIDPYIITDAMPSVQIPTDVMTWLLSEFHADDGYNIILLMHQLFTDTYIHRDGTKQTWADAPVILENLWDAVKDRQNGRSGNITDSEGVSHGYDFSGTTTKILCALHGHAHEELFLQEDGVISYACDWAGNYYCCTFGLIDTLRNRLSVWRFTTDAVYDPLVLTI